MSTNLLNKIMIMSKYAILGMFLQTILFSLISAREVEGQNSIEDVFLDIDLNGLRIERALEEIEKETVFKFSYKKSAFSNKKILNQHLGKSSLADILRQIGKEYNLKFRRINETIHVSKSSEGFVKISEYDSEVKDVTVSGTVTDDNGEPLIGAGIIVQGTSIGTIADIDGMYSLSVPENSTLVFSYIGYTTKEIAIGSLSVIDVILEEDTKTLSEVIVVGYTEKDVRKLTSSISTVTSDQIQQVPMSTFDNILQGTAPGLLVQSGTGQPGRSAEVTIRGTKSINFSIAPLYILDGIPITGGDFAAINPNDIGSVSILKDAAATQIYGSRGANGVVVITSKSGVKGKTKVEYHTFFGISPRPQYNDGLRPLTSAQLIDLQHEIGIGGTIGLPQEELDSLKNINTDWLAATTRDAKIQSHEMSISGGGENSTFYISGSYFKQEGTSLRSELNRYSLRTKVTHEKDNFRIGTNLYLAHTDTQDSESEGSFGRSNPFYSSIRANPYDYDFDPRTGEYALPQDLSASSTFNILERIKTNDENRSINQVIASVNGRYKLPFLKGLSVASRWGVSYSQRDNIDYVDPNSFSGPSFQGGQGRLFHSFTRRVRFTGTNSIHYDLNVGTDHTFNVALYQEYIYFNGKSVELEAYGLDKIATVEGATQGADENGFIPEFGGDIPENALSSYFATIDYSFKNRYNITAGIRRDGSSRFGKNNRFGTFYSAGLGWIISDEDFLSSSDFVNYLKFRTSYGTVGSQDFDDVTDDPNVATRPIFVPDGYNGSAGLTAALSNPDLQWEQTEKLNIGFDLTLMRGFLSMNVDFYNEKTSNLLNFVPISLTSGFGEQLRNSGDLRNRGIELSITTKNVDTGNLKWTTGLNIARNKTTVIKLFNGESFRIDDFLYEEGKELGVYNLVRRSGINPATGRTVWYDNEGNLTETFDEDNAVNIAPSSPKFYGGLTNTVSYKGFQIRALFTFAQGHSIFNRVRTSLDNPTKISRGSVSTNALRFWRQPGDITDLPDPAKESTYRDDSGWVEDASYIKLRNVIVSYNFPSWATSKLKITGLRIFAQGQNLFTWTTFSGLDPENSGSSYVADYPSLSTYTLGLDVKF